MFTDPTVHKFLEAANSRNFPKARELARQLALDHNFKLNSRPVKALPKLSPGDNFARFRAAAAKFAFTPTARNYTDWQKADSTYLTAVLSAIDKRAKVMSPDVRALEPAAPIVRHCCSTSLEWQTNPSIGRNPADLVEFDPSRVKLSSGDKTVNGTAKSVTTLTVYHKGTPSTEEYPNVGAALMDAYDLTEVSWMICVDSQMVHFHSVTEE